MMRQIQNEIRQLRLPVIILFFVGTISLCSSCYLISTNTALAYGIEMWIYGCEFVDFFFPLLATLPFAYSLYGKRKNNFLSYASLRMNQKRYLCAQIIAGMCLSFLMIFFMYLIGLCCCLYLFPIQFQDIQSNLKIQVFGTCQMEHPLFFGLLWCTWKGVIAGMLVHFTYQLGRYLDHLFLIAILPFLYSLAENLITALLGIPQYSLTTSYVLNRLSSKGMGIFNYVAGILVFLIFTNTAIFLLKRWKEHL